MGIANDFVQYCCAFKIVVVWFEIKSSNIAIELHQKY